MGVLGKLMFWRKKDELGADNLGLPKDTFPTPNPYPGDYGQQQSWSQPGMGSYPQPQMPIQQPQMESLQSSNAYTASKQMELVSAKLDALKAAIDTLNQRIANMERVRETEDYYRKKGW